MCFEQRDFSINIERVLWETFLRPIMYWPKKGIVKARKLGARSKMFHFLKW